MTYKTNEFKNNYILIKKKKLKYYLSTLLLKFDFKHAFFTKESSEFPIEELAKNFNNNEINYFNNQIHSNLVVNASNSNFSKKFYADGIVSEKSNQNIWIYTADCMPILLADRKTRLVSAIHCGRKGLEKKIIQQMIEKMENLGSLRKDILIAIGPSISKVNYLVDQKCLENFYKNISNTLELNNNLRINSEDIFKYSKNGFPLDMRKYAFEELISNKIIPDNIDVSNNCTYELNHEFYSWRRQNTEKRNWNFITSKLI